MDWKSSWHTGTASDKKQREQNKIKNQPCKFHFFTQLVVIACMLLKSNQNKISEKLQLWIGSLWIGVDTSNLTQILKEKNKNYERSKVIVGEKWQCPLMDLVNGCWLISVTFKWDLQMLPILICFDARELKYFSI